MDVKESTLFGMTANLSVNQECDSGPSMTINSLGPVASLEEIDGSVVFPPKYLTPKYLTPEPSVINSRGYQTDTSVILQAAKLQDPGDSTVRMRLSGRGQY